MQKEIRTALLNIAKELNNDYKYAYAHSKSINCDYFISKIRAICNESKPSKRKLDDILFNSNIMKKTALIKDMEIVTEGKVPSAETEHIMLHAETLNAPLHLYPQKVCTRYVKPRNNTTVNLSAKDVGNVLHQLL